MYSAYGCDTDVGGIVLECYIHSRLSGAATVTCQSLRMTTPRDQAYSIAQYLPTLQASTPRKGPLGRPRYNSFSLPFAYTGACPSCSPEQRTSAPTYERSTWGPMHRSTCVRLESCPVRLCLVRDAPLPRVVALVRLLRLVVGQLRSPVMRER